MTWMPAAKGCPCGGEVRVRHAARRRAVAGRRERALDFGARPCARGRPRSLGAGSESNPQTLSPQALRTIPEPQLFRPAATFKSINMIYFFILKLICHTDQIGCQIRLMKNKSI